MYHWLKTLAFVFKWELVWIKEPTDETHLTRVRLTTPWGKECFRDWSSGYGLLYLKPNGGCTSNRFTTNGINAEGFVWAPYKKIDTAEKVEKPTRYQILKNGGSEDSKICAACKKIRGVA